MRQKASGAMWIAEKRSRKRLAINALTPEDVARMIDRAKKGGSLFCKVGQMHSSVPLCQSFTITCLSSAEDILFRTTFGVRLSTLFGSVYLIGSFQTF